MSMAACGTKGQEQPPPVDEIALCGTDYPSYAPGMTVKAGALTAKLISASPSPPRQKVPNHWIVELRDEQGKPVTDYTLSTPDSFMPAHNHHGRSAPSAEPGLEAARAQIRDIDFNMRGPWQVLFDVERPGAKPVTATFQVCVH